MRRGVPVACSDLPVLREVGGDVPDYFAPDDDAGATAAIVRAMADGDAGRERGPERAARFTWAAAAHGTLAAYERALRVMHVGLNLVFMVPGQTGGMEVAARALIPALRDAAPGVALHRVRQSRGRRRGPRDRVRRRAGRGDAAASSGCAASSSCCPAWRAAPAATSCTRSRRPRRRAAASPAWSRSTTSTTSMVPEAHFGLRAVGMRVLVPLAARTSHRVIADSGATRDDLVDAPARPGRQGRRRAARTRASRDAPPRRRTSCARASRSARRQVLLSLSAKRPHKNLRGLLDALAPDPAERRPVLVLPGYPTPHEAELREHAAALGVSDDVRFLGWTSEADVEGLFALCGAFVFPSFYEGFGLPVLEAMARGVPVACSDRASLPEVAGDAALLFDPADPAAIAAALERLLGDPAQADRLRAAGRARAAAFTWERTAQLTLASYERALASASAA